MVSFGNVLYFQMFPWFEVPDACFEDDQALDQLYEAFDDLRGFSDFSIQRI